MDSQTPAACAADAAAFAQIWHEPPPPVDLHAAVIRFFKPGETLYLTWVSQRAKAKGTRMDDYMQRSTPSMCEESLREPKCCWMKNASARRVARRSIGSWRASALPRTDWERE
jgi:hypothetical protein